MLSTRLGWQLTRSVRGSVLPRSRQLGKRRRLRKQLQQSSSECVKASVWVYATSAWCSRAIAGGAEALWEVEQGAAAGRVSCPLFGWDQGGRHSCVARWGLPEGSAAFRLQSGGQFDAPGAELLCAVKCSRKKNYLPL